jgi:hypothetical protein
MNKIWVGVLCTTMVLLLVVAPIFFGATPAGKAMWNNWFHDVQKADDATNYKTRKQVEDTCRSMIATYEKDKAEYEANMKLYETTGDKYYLEIATGYRQQANSSASTYNNYVLKNSYVFEGNVPVDIRMKLEILK